MVTILLAKVQYSDTSNSFTNQSDARVNFDELKQR